MKATSLINSIGKTPLIKLQSLSKDLPGDIYAKQESRNPLGSVKDRVALFMIEAGERDGRITQSTTIIEPTSGNTGLGLAFICAAKKLKLILTMPESMSIERRQMLSHLGAELVLTPAKHGMKGAIATAESIKQKTENSFIPNQFSNPACPEAHRKTTAVEIWEQTEGNIDFFVSGVGTGGTITGVSEVIKSKKPSMKSIAVEPADSPVLSGGQPSPHPIQGIGAGFVPEVLNVDIIDEIVTVTGEDSIKTAKLLSQTEGIFCGISSGAAVWAAIKIAEKTENTGKNIITVLPDTGERYLSTSLFMSE